MSTNKRVERALAAIEGQRWPGPQRDERIERLIREVQQMKQQTHKRYSIGALIAVGVTALVGGGAIAGAVTHQIMAQRAILTTEDGTEYEVMLSPTTEGAAGTFVTDDGQVFGIDMIQDGDQKQVTVDVTGAAGDQTSTVTIEEDGSDS